jgi:HAD superfamily hydrolase (TIGR01490 family)
VVGDRAAFFDFDRTLIDADAGVLFGLSLGKKAYAEAARFRSKAARAAYYTYVTGRFASALAQGAVVSGLATIKVVKRSTQVRFGYSLLKGVASDDARERITGIWDERIRNLFYPEMLKIVAEHRARGDRVVIVTTGLKPLVELSRDVLGKDTEIIACEPLEENGFWLGKVKGPLYGREKRDAVEAYAKANNIDLAESTAYSDHWSDVAFLEAVGSPVVVNPNLRLAILARKRGWRILRLPPPTFPRPTPAENGA